MENGIGKATVVEGVCGSSDTSRLKSFTVECGNEAGRQVKDKSKVRSSDMISPQNTSYSRPYKKRMNVLFVKGPTSQKVGPTKGEDFEVKATNRTSDKAGVQLGSDSSVKTNNHVLEVTRRPDAVSP